jgi:hypothetical protein
VSPRVLFAAAYVSGALWMLGWELAAFAVGRTDLTITDFTLRFEGAGWTAARYVMAAFLLWALLHLTLGWFR